MDSREQFTFYRSFYAAVMKLPKCHRLAMFLAIVEYALDRKEPDHLNIQQQGQFELVRPVLNAAWRKAQSGSIGGKASKQGSKKEKENKVEKEVEKESQAFASFWERYPLKLGKAEARRVWESLDDHEEVFNGLDRWLGSEMWKRENGRFIPKAKKWLEERWFLDSPKQSVIYGASGQLGEAELEAIQRLLKEEL